MWRWRVALVSVLVGGSKHRAAHRAAHIRLRAEQRLRVRSRGAKQGPDSARVNARVTHFDVFHVVQLQRKRAACTCNAMQRKAFRHVGVQTRGVQRIVGVQTDAWGTGGFLTFRNA